MDVARYKLSTSMKSYDLNSEQLYRWNHTSVLFDGDNDIDGLDNRLKAAGRYWCAKYSAIERHKNLKRIRITVPKKSSVTIPVDFIPLLHDENPVRGVDGGSYSRASVVEESWEDEVLRKTREFNKMLREHPHDEKIWLGYSDFQDKVASMQPQKGARLQTLEKKISVLEKATELNPENEELLLCLLNAYRSRDGTDVLIGRWEKVLLQHSGSCKLWKEFLHVVQGEFSLFKVSEMRKIYVNAIRALSAACSRQCRQVLNFIDSVFIFLYILCNLYRVASLILFEEIVAGMFHLIDLSSCQGFWRVDFLRSSPDYFILLMPKK